MFSPLSVQRSGTGKTNVLFQHAVAYAKALAPGTTDKPICFITVSPNLKRELERRFQEVQELNQIALPPILFFSFRDFIDRLVGAKQIMTFKEQSACKFLEYVNARKSYKKLDAEQNLIENEIGGVILGSLEAALTKEPLTQSQYLSENRSNVPNESEQGRNDRSAIYLEYERYRKWKMEEDKYDLHDVVLELIRSGVKDELFRSGK